MNNKFNKNNWKKVSLSEVCKKTEFKETKPLEKGIYRFLKVSHLEAENLNISNWADMREEELPPTFYKRFIPGQVLFPTRNPHLRRAVYANFEGICGEKTLTLSPDKNIINPKLFPFLFHSDSFVNHCIGFIVGSTNPHVRWRDIAKYEFLLPPLEEQEKLADLLWTGDIVNNKYDFFKSKLQMEFTTVLNRLIPKPNNYEKIGKRIEIQKGLTYRSSDYSDKANGIPMVNLKCFKKYGGFSKNGVKYFNGKFSEKHKLNKDDLIIALTDITREGAVVGFPIFTPELGENVVFTMDVAKLKILDKIIDPKYLYYLLRSHWAHWHMFAHACGTTVLHLDLKAIQKLLFPKISIDDQKSIVQKLEIIEKSLDENTQTIKKLKLLNKTLTNQLFE